MPKRKRTSTKQTNEEEAISAPIESTEALPNIENQQDDKAPDWQVIVHRKSRKGSTINEFPEFNKLGQNLGYTVELNGKKGAWEAMKQYRRYNLDETSDEYDVGEYIAVCYTDADADGDEVAQDPAQQEDANAEEEKEDQQGPWKRQKLSNPPTPPDEPSTIEIVNEDDSTLSLDTSGIAKVLECRAADSEHVYLRILWLYKPEDTEDGRQPWHAEDEVIPSTHQQVIDATACNGKVEVLKWEPGVDAHPVQRRRYWWRQTLDLVGKTRLSAIEDECVCRRPTDLSKGIYARDLVQCTNVECEGWMHTKCLCGAAKAQVIADIRKGESPFEGAEEKETTPAHTDVSEQLENTLRSPSKSFNTIRDHIGSFTSGLANMVKSINTTPRRPSSEKENLTNGHTTNGTTTKSKGKRKRKDSDKDADGDQDENNIIAEVDHDTYQIKLKEVETKRHITIPVTCLICQEVLSPPAPAVEAEAEVDGE